MNITDLLDEAYGWTTKRVAAVRASDLDARTPCERWNLRQLLNHMLGSLQLHLDAVAGKQVEGRGQFDPDTDRIGDDPAMAFNALAARAEQTWHTPGVFDGTCVLPIGPMPTRVVAVLHLTEVVLHGWDVGQATAERAPVPAGLAEVILQQAGPLVTEAHRGTAFGPDLGTGVTPAERLLTFFGRTT